MMKKNKHLKPINIDKKLPRINKEFKAFINYVDEKEKTALAHLCKYYGMDKPNEAIVYAYKAGFVDGMLWPEHRNAIFKEDTLLRKWLKKFIKLYRRTDRQ